MKILFVSDVAYPWSKGGSEYRIHKIAKVLEKDHDVSMVSAKWWNGEQPNQKIVGIPMIGSLYRKRRSTLSAATFTASLFEKISHLERDFDIIEFNQTPMLHFLLLKLFRHCQGSKPPVIVGAMHEAWLDYWLDYAGPLTGTVGYSVEHYAARQLDHIITISEFNKRRFRRWKIPDQKMSVVRPGIDYNEIAGAPASSLRSDLIFVGRLVQEKRVDVLIRAVRVLKDEYHLEIKTVIVGTGPMLEELQSLTRQLSLQDQVLFTGKVDQHSDVFSLMKGSRVYVYPAPPEGGWIIAGMEANAAGLPIVSSDTSAIGSSREIITNWKNGFIVPDLSPKSFAAKIRVLLTDRDLYGSMSKYSESLAKQYDWTEIAKQVSDLYERLLAERKRTTAS
jgi:glycosyltransferase involved in cell wall biosynthesis